MKSVRSRMVWPFVQSLVLATLFTSVFIGCGSKILKYEKEDQLKANIEFEQAVKIDNLKEAPSQSTPPPSSSSPLPPSLSPSSSSSSISDSLVSLTRNDHKPTPLLVKEDKVSKSRALNKKKKEKISSSSITPSGAKFSASSLKESSVAMGPAQHLPDIEDGAGFDGRRPLVDPFKVGESVVHDVSYYKVSAGEFEMGVNPFKLVNDQKSYSFSFNLKSSDLFSKFYSVDDNVETLVDFNQLVPKTYSLHVKESGQLREVRSLFNHESLTATFWEKKYTQKSGNEEKKQDWQILPYSQNVFSAIFYMRVFQWSVGKEIFFRIAHDQENILFKAKGIRKERLETKVGTFNTIVIKPEVSVKGIFKPMGDIYFWLSDDDRRYILRIEMSIKIGTITSEVIRLIPGS